MAGEHPPIKQSRSRLRASQASNLAIEVGNVLGILPLTVDFVLLFSLELGFQCTDLALVGEDGVAG